MAQESRAHVLREALAQAHARLHDTPRPGPVEADVLAARAVHFAGAVRFAAEHPWTVHHLQATIGELAASDSLETLLPLVVEHGIVLSGADLGNVQMLDPATGALYLVAHRGFDGEFLRRYAVVDGGRTSCAVAAAASAQVVVRRVPEQERRGRDRGPDLFTAVQSTPLKDFAGRVVGVLSTHWRRPSWSGDPDLRLVELYADYAGDRLAQLLGRSSSPAIAGPDEVGPVARAMLLALLDPPERPADRGPDGVLLAGPMARAFPGDRLASFADLVVTGLFTTGLELDSARSTAHEHHPADRVLAERLSSATRHLDRMLEQVRAFMVRHGDDPDEV